MLMVHGLLPLLALPLLTAAGSPSELSLSKLIHDYSAIAPVRLTGTAADWATSDWIFHELKAAGLEVQRQSYTLPGPKVWIPQADGAPFGGYGCQLVVDGTPIPCYVVQQPPLNLTTLHDVPMMRVLVVSIAKVYMLKAEDAYRSFLRPDGTLPYDAVIVINGLSSSNVTQPRPFDWNQQLRAPALVPVVTVSDAFTRLLRNAQRVTSLKLLGSRPHRNILAQLPAPKNCKTPGRPLYVGTPINGFFRAAGERGAGIAMLLAIAKAFVSCGSEASVSRPSCRRPWSPIFAFTSGHEQYDPGISQGAIPFLQELAASQNLTLAEIPFISIGASLGVHAHFEGSNLQGQGTGSVPIKVETSRGSGLGIGMLNEVLGHLQRLSGPLVQTRPGQLDVTSAVGAVEQALHVGMPAMS
eukprot:Skav201005  [mRNA]  locus=scaffold991:234303:235799:+ [translate_table: standard]